MKKIIIFASLLIAAVVGVSSCSDESTWDTYKDWRETNEQFYQEQKSLKNPDNTPFYTALNPNWLPNSGVLIHFFNDRSLTAGNLVPLVTSTVDVKYKGWLCNDVAFDSSYTATTYGDSIFRTIPSQTIVGWQVALTNMAVGDSARVVIPWSLAYGTQSTGSIAPFSNLVFDIKLVDIYSYETQQ
ncbi:MAG: FKBP-type peptidyl-prolyl cis-trans isomerase [Paramuribaculum sp.]|nr:FKBP-type peptidyl-prolyl cis-trans isomerase [Paramuribaculum sp.]MDE6651211.1 FKBP-type peptidyl-prolyl cis-trans isomerase [Paramuribaculum sp.]